MLNRISAHTTVFKLLATTTRAGVVSADSFAKVPDGFNLFFLLDLFGGASWFLAFKLPSPIGFVSYLHQQTTGF